jgi:hypothetical protein
MTTTGPFELSGTAAGVSVEGPMASVSARFSGAGIVAAVAAACELCAGVVSGVCGAAISLGPVVVGSEGCAAVFAAAGATLDGGSVFISTGLDDSSSGGFSGRDPAVACCALLCAGVDGWFAPAEAMATGLVSHATIVATAIVRCRAYEWHVFSGCWVLEAAAGSGREERRGGAQAGGEWSQQLIMDRRGNRARPVEDAAPCSPQLANTSRRLHQNRAIGAVNDQAGIALLGLQSGPFPVLSLPLARPFSQVASSAGCQLVMPRQPRFGVPGSIAPACF